jgi:putative ABC transport system permease protein
MFAEVLGSILASSSIFLTYAMLLVVRTHPWWDAQYFIPMLGMLLGNCISGISVGLTTLLEELTSGAQVVPTLPHLFRVSRLDSERLIIAAWFAAQSAARNAGRAVICVDHHHHHQQRRC